MPHLLFAKIPYFSEVSTKPYIFYELSSNIYSFKDCCSPHSKQCSKNWDNKYKGNRFLPFSCLWTHTRKRTDGVAGCSALWVRSHRACCCKAQGRVCSCCLELDQMRTGLRRGTNWREGVGFPKHQVQGMHNPGNARAHSVWFDSRDKV